MMTSQSAMALRVGALLGAMMLAGCPSGSSTSTGPDSQGADAGAQAASGVAEVPKQDDPEAVRWRHLTDPPTPPGAGPLSPQAQAEAQALIDLQPQALGHSLNALHTYGPSIEPMVLKLLSDPVPLRRVVGVQLVENMRLTGAYRMLAEMTRDKDARVRRAAIEAVGSRGDGAMLKALVPLVESSETTVWMRSARYAAEAGRRDIVPQMRNRAEVERLVWRLRSIEALALVALPQDSPWFAEQLAAPGPLPPNELVALWTGLTTADPKLAWLTLEKRRQKADEPLNDRDHHAALAVIAPHVPAEQILLLARQAIGPRYQPRLRNLVRALSLTPGADVDAEVARLLSRGLYTCDLHGARLQREAELTDFIARLEAALADPPEGSDAAALQQRLTLARADLAELKPRAEVAVGKLQERLRAGKGTCRGEMAALTPERLAQLAVPLLEAQEPAARAGAAALLGAHGQWEDARQIARVLHDQAPEVRAEARAALRQLLGRDLRLPGGFVWDIWYVRTFGPLPEQTFPVADRRAALQADYEASLEVRPPAAVPASVPQAPRAQPTIRVPDGVDPLDPFPAPLDDLDETPPPANPAPGDTPADPAPGDAPADPAP